MTTVSQEAVEVTQADRDAVAEFHRQSLKALFTTTDDDINAGINRAHEMLCQAFARHRQSAERGEVVGYIIPEMLNRKSEFEANGIVLHSRPSGMATMPLYTLPTPPEAA